MSIKIKRWYMYVCHSRLLSLFLGLALVLLPMGAQWSSVKAQTPCPSIANSIPLVSEIPEQSSEDIGRDFYTTTVSVEFRPGQLAILTSSPDGQGATRTDDRFWIRVSPSEREWSHDYRNAARTQIVPLPAQDISHLFVVGKNTVTVGVTDLIGPKYSSQPFYLVLIDTCPTPTSVPTPTPIASSTPVLPTPTPEIQVVVVTATPSDTPVSTVTPVLATATVTPATLPMASTHIESPDFFADMARWMFVGFLLSVGGTGIWWWTRRTQPLFAGEIDVYQHQHYVTTYDLAAIKKTPVIIGQQGDIMLPDLIDEGPMVRITNRAGEGATQPVTVAELLNPYNAEEVLETSILTDGYGLTVGPYRLQYRSYQPEETILEEESDV